MIRLALKAVGTAAVTLGGLAIAFGSYWASEALEFFASSPIGSAPEIFVPFLPIFLIAIGAFFVVRARG